MYFFTGHSQQESIEMVHQMLDREHREVAAFAALLERLTGEMAEAVA